MMSGMSESGRPLRYRGLSRDRAERVARTLGRFYPLLLAIVVGLLAVLRRRDGNILADLPLWVVFAIGISLGLWLLVVWKFSDRVGSRDDDRAS
jgi:hypothetical protein